MIRGISIALGVGLIILWLVGLSDHGTMWLTWLDGAAALGAFGIAALAPDAASPRAASAPLLMAVAMFLIWIIALVTGADRWLAWWTFAFACGFLVVGFLASSQRDRGVRARLA